MATAKGRKVQSCEYRGHKTDADGLTTFTWLMRVSDIEWPLYYCLATYDKEDTWPEDLETRLRHVAIGGVLRYSIEQDKANHEKYGLPWRQENAK